MRPVARFPAIAAEPRWPGIAGARDPLAREVRLLGALLGQVIAEQAGPEVFGLVERIRLRMIGLRRGDPDVLLEPDAEREAIDAELRGLDLGSAAAVAKAFTVYFQLVNLAEERQRVRMLRLRARRAGGRPIDDSVADALERLARTHDPEAVRRLVSRLEIHPVLTAHPTEARRRTLLVALRRIRRQLHLLDDPRIGPDDDADARRRLREEITLLWHTADLRATPPAPLDEVRSALAIFDDTLFAVVPRLQRAFDRAFDDVLAGSPHPPTAAGPTGYASDAGRSGTRPPLVPPVLAFGSWIGGDRDGHPGVTAETTLATARLHADHLLRGYEAVLLRLMQTVAARVAPERVDRRLESALARDAEDLPETVRQVRRRFPEEPYRQRFGAMAERVRRTRAMLTGETSSRTGGYADPAAEAGIHAYAARSGKYQPVTDWRMENGNLIGRFEAPLAVGIVGGVTRLHPTARVALKMLGITCSEDLGRICAAVGLVQNLGALKALATVGIVKGHMQLHAANLAIAAGAGAHEIGAVRDRLNVVLEKEKKINLSQAIAILEEIRRGQPESAKVFH